MRSPFFVLPLRDLLIGSKQLAIVEACVIGLVSGLAAVLLKQGIGLLGGWRVQMSYQFAAWWVLPVFGLVGGVLAGLLVERLAPEAVGSGIPQVKAALANVPIILNLRVAIVKLASVILVVGSGMNVGRQGPTVHVGAALAAQLSQWIPASPEYRRQLIAAGTAAGLAAGFNAPISGVLFVVEEFLQDFSGITLGTAILASFIGAVVSRLLGGRGLSLDPLMTAYEASFSLQDVPVFLLLGLLAGLLGALFHRGIFAGLALNRRLLPLGLPGRIGLAGLVSGLIVTQLPATFRDNTGLQDMISAGDAGWQVTLLAFVAKFLLTLLAVGSGAPGGIFSPSLVLGAALGYLVGTGAHQLESLMGLADGLSSPSTYALAGMGAFFSAVTRGPITAIVIVFEITANFNLVLPLMIGSVIAYLVSYNLVGGSIYGQLLAWNGIHLDQPAPPAGPWHNLTAAMLMQRRVQTLSIHMTVTEAMQAFARSHHRGFPVVDEGRLVGIVTQTDLADPTRRPAALEEATLADIMTPQPVTVTPQDRLTHVLFLLNRFQISRLPVTEAQKLVGIITRADIIRAESDHLSGELVPLGPRPEPSYVVFQTRSPATGRGRLLLPLSNPQTAPTLLKLAAAIARDRHYELELLHVHTVSRSRAPAQTPVRTTNSRRLLRQMEQLARQWPISVHTQVRVAHDPAQAMLEAIEERHIDLVLMGWKGSTSTPGRVFGTAVDTIIRQATAEVVLVKLGDSEQFDRWLVPISGGPNVPCALTLLPALTSLSTQPSIKICQVLPPNLRLADTPLMLSAVETLQQRITGAIVTRAIGGDSVPEAVLQLAWQEPCDVIILGASREGLLTQVVQGNIPEAIAHYSDRTVILVRGAILPDH